MNTINVNPTQNLRPDVDSIIPVDSSSDSPPSPSETTDETANEAANLDAYYARLVAGAAVSVSFKAIWVPGSENGLDSTDLANFNEIVWTVIKEAVLGILEITDTSSNGARPNSQDIARPAKSNNILNYQVSCFAQITSRFGVRMTFCYVLMKQEATLSEGLLHVKKELEKKWLVLNKFRVSDQVHMVETEILRRLHQDGAFRWLAPPWTEDHMTQLRLCFIMRRTTAIRYQFAAAVGKRLFSAKVSC